MGQTRIPGIVVLALIILLFAVFSIFQWIVERTAGTTWSGLVWPFFGIALAFLIIVIWVLTRTAPRR